MKQLIINNKLYAKYEMEGAVLFLKMIIPIVKGDERRSEDLLIKIIRSIENVSIHSVAYLNVK